MPCSGGQDCGRVEYRYEKVPVYMPTPEQQYDNQRNKKIARDYAAIICALLNDLKNRGILEDVLNTAEQDGQIDIRSFMVEHEREDLDRLKEYLLKFSKHERQMILNILKDETF